ncbi:hypothetical protein LCGC14_0401670 [marine sediment metagenome]|uniref:Uncharacterized protein n=1 Tax=marine sediment metagenome TaxID=412755 RepID=A0A0F9T2B6_9ZZZZ
MVDLKMDGIRRWKFTSSAGVIELINTDFWIDYDSTVQGTGTAELSLTLTNIWQHSDLDLLQGLARRKFVEDRLKELHWDHVGKKGTLIIDEGTPQEVTIDGVTLLDVVTEMGDLNDLMEYSLVFSFPLTSSSGTGGVEIARELSFLAWGHNFAQKSEKLNLSPWNNQNSGGLTPDDIIAPDGALTADKLTDSDGGNFFRVQQTVPLGSTKPDLYEFTLFVPVLSSQTLWQGFIAEVAGGGTPVDTAYTIDQVNGALVLRAGSVAAQFTRVDRFNADWWRIGIRLQNNASGNDDAVIRLQPTVNTDGTGTWVASVTGDNHTWGFQVSRVHANKTSLIPYVPTDAAAIGTTPLAPSLENYVIAREREDRAVFKDVFRASPIRVAGSPGRVRLNVVGIKQLTTQTEATLLQRQEAEGIIEAWNDLVGKDGLLRIDNGVTGEEQIAAHLSGVSIGDLRLPDAVTFDLRFETEYSE